MDNLKNKQKPDVSLTEKNSTPQDRAMVMPADKNDGNLNVTFYDDDLEARADFNPPMGSGTPITEEYISEALNRLNITYGVLWENIREAMDACNQHRKPVKDILIARGDPPVNEVAEYFAINPHLTQRTEPAKKGTRVDYRTYSPFIIVKKNQALARLRPRIAGKDGKNVHGMTISYAVLRPEGVTGGEHTRTEGNFILSEINGQLIKNKTVLSVQDSLVIKGTVGYATGNIIFPGDVVIEGPVSDGFKIYSGGSVTIKQTFDVTDVSTRGDLSVAGGMIGRGRALVKVGGTLKTKFIENCRVAVRKTITVDSTIINSSVFTMETLEMGDKGLILGGDINAIHGIRAGAIGKKSGKATRIHCGIDFTAQQEKEKNNNGLRILAAKLAKLRELMALPEDSREKQAKMAELLHRLEEEQKKLGTQTADIMGRINVDENALVEVTGEIAEGTLIEICQIALFVTEPIKKVRIRLDKTKGKLIHESL
ncbi:MAG: FapA family protein [Treponema sp.]|jgi:uncharacterized protein (DUF342 family)|nr:FapA family protein [Treponema sp.]